MESLKFLQVSEDRVLPIPQTAEVRRYTFGSFELDTEKHLLLKAGTPVALPPKCFDLLCVLLRSNNRLVAKDQLMRVLWPDTFVEESNLSNLIAALRKALGDSPAQSQFIQTVPKRGYRFSGPVASPVDSISKTRGPALVESARAIRIIVFPFRASMGFADPDGLTQAFPDAITTTLAEMNAFVVRSVQLARTFDPVHWVPKIVAREADVDFIVSGSLGCGGGDLHAVVQLMQAETGTLLWSKSWDLPKRDLVSLHQAVVHLLVHTLVRGVCDEDTPAARSGMPEHPDAYNIYLRANQISSSQTQPSTVLGRDLYVACLEKDPTFAPAWARLGRCYHVLRKFYTEQSIPANAASDAFERAFSVDPNLVLAHSLYTPMQADAGEAEDAMIRLLGQLRRHPNAPEILAALVHACRYCGQLEASIAAHKKALELDPHVRTSVTHTYFAMADYQRSLFWYGNSALYLDALALACMGRNKEAAALLWTRQDRFHSMHAPMHALDAHLRGDPKKGIAALHEAVSDQRYEPEVQFYMARQAARFDEVDLAITFLAQSVKAGYWSTVALQRDPWLSSVRATAPFADVFEDVSEREKKARIAFLEADGHLLLGVPSNDPISEWRNNPADRGLS